MGDRRFIFSYLLAAKIIALLFLPTVAISQTFDNTAIDTSYYQVYPKMLTTRFYFSRKYTDFKIRSDGKTDDLGYRSNTTLNMGVGVTYQKFSLNLAYGFGFLNPDLGQGKTKYLDLQGHFYPGRWSIDWLGQFYKGYYLEPKGYVAPAFDNYYVRPDINVNLFGLAAYRVINNNKFSYRAAIIQDGWQKKSAGSFLLGGEIHYGKIKADSAFVPHNVENEFAQAGTDELRYFSFGPGAGYAYTLVFQHHFFLTGSLTSNLNLEFTTENSPGNNSHNFYLNPSAIFRLAAGYNSSIWNISANWVGNKLPVRGETSTNNYLLETGNYRLILSKKIMPGPKLRKQLTRIDPIFR